jgi:putative ABC transport system permease protein
MFWTYLFRELSNRRKQTAIIATGLALAIALVIIVNSVAGGVKAAQSTVLQSVYGVGTDITISQADTPSSTSGRPTFSFGSGGGTSSGTAGSGSSTTLDQSRVTVARGTASFASSTLATVQKTSGVKAAAATLSLQETNFSGSVTQRPTQSSGGSSTSGGGQRTGTGAGGGVTGGGFGGGFGGGNFSFDSTTIEGVDVTADAVGPISSVSLSSGRTFTAADTGKDVVVFDKSYAKTNSKKVGDTVTIGSTKFTVIGLVASASSSSATASNMYIPLDTAQKIASLTGKVTNIYVTADSSNDVSSLKTTLEKALPKATVSTEADLASSVSGSLSTASGLVSSLGTWLSVIVLAAAFLIAILFTVSGVTRRTREFGTLKAIGWSNGRIVRQVAGESLVQGLIGGAVGVAVGLIGVLVINIVGPTLSGGATTTSAFGSGFGRAGGAGAAGAAPGGTSSGTEAAASGAARFGQAAAKATTSVTLHAPIAVEIIVIAVVLAIVGGLLAGAIGGWRASRLRPAEALRSVA